MAYVSHGSWSGHHSCRDTGPTIDFVPPSRKGCYQPPPASIPYRYVLVKEELLSELYAMEGDAAISDFDGQELTHVLPLS